MSLVLEVLNKDLIVMKSELEDAEKRKEQMMNGDGDGDCCQISGSVAYFEGYISGLEQAIKAIKSDRQVDNILTGG